jgi:hypothetical protein
MVSSEPATHGGSAGLKLGADGVAADRYESRRSSWRRSKKARVGSDTAGARLQVEAPKPPNLEAENEEGGIRAAGVHNR